MSNTDGEDTQRIKLTLKDAGYKYFTCPMCDGHGQIGQDQHDQNNKDVEAQIETVQELASLREQLANEQDANALLKNAIDEADRQLKQKEDENRELIGIAKLYITLKKQILDYLPDKDEEKFELDEIESFIAKLSKL